MKEELQRRIGQGIRELFDVATKVELTRPEEQYGDYATNVALQLAGKLGRNPREVADELANKLRGELTEQINEVTVAGPGFINLRLSDQALIAKMDEKPARNNEGQTVVAEYSDPN